MADALKPRRQTTQKKGQAVSISEGANLYDQAQRVRQVYLLNAGQVRLIGRNGVIFDHLKRGSFLGERALLKSDFNNHAAIALSPVEATGFRKVDLKAEWQRNPDFALRLVKDLATRLERYEELICDLVTEQAEMRLARLLLRTAPSRPPSGWVRLPFRFTNVELAKMIGTTRWRISYLLNRFQRLGWLRRDQQLWLRREGALSYLTER
jgi:CRP/FNR family cyclic AMP-dependent transcriptional regulator